MYGLRVASVGDGACSVFLSGGGLQPAMIVDCGSRRDPQRAVAGLQRILSLHPRPSLTVVVTHLHEDHYNGLLHLSRILNRQHVFARIELIQARLPRHPITAEFVARLWALEGFLGESSGVPDIDLASRLGTSCSQGLGRRPMSEGDHFQAGGHTFEVLWPPPVLSGDLAVRVHAAVEAYDRLAVKLPSLEGALERVRRPEAGEQVERSPWAFEDDMLEEDMVEDMDTREGDESVEPPTLHGTSRIPDRAQRAYPDDLASEVQDAARLFREAANYMSLVFATPRRDFVSWGDVPQGLARRIVRKHPAVGASGRTRGIALAPHHGSQGPSPTFGHPFVCIGQNGDQLRAKWEFKHAGCAAEVCLSTGDEGDLEIRDRWFPLW